VRIDRAQPIPPKNFALWLEEIERDFSQEFENHFSAEESVLFPAARQFPEMTPLLDELISDHAKLRECFSRMGAGTISLEALPDFARQLSVHIRKEERQLFERLQQLLTAEQLKHLGAQLESALEVTERACSLPGEETRLKPRSKQSLKRSLKQRS
jgi:hemerythrin-like domain-containing protein